MSELNTQPTEARRAEIAAARDLILRAAKVFAEAKALEEKGEALTGNMQPHLCGATYRARQLLEDAVDSELSRLTAELARQTAMVEGMRADGMKLVDFAEGMIQDAFDGRDVEGSDIQERAVACGLIIETTYSYERHGENEVDAEDGDPWYKFSPAFKAAIHASALAAGEGK